MKRTVCLKLVFQQNTFNDVSETQRMFLDACNYIVTFVVKHRCWNTYNLHSLCYYLVREHFPSLGSQMVCCAIKKVCAAYKALKITPAQKVPTIRFRSEASVHYDKRTYSLDKDTLSLFTVKGRVHCSFQIGPYQEEYLAIGKPKEAEMIRKGKRFFLNLVLDIPDVKSVQTGSTMALDLGENNLATTSNGTIFGGGRLRDTRDRFLARCRKLQSNGSASARCCLKRISGNERRHVKDVNHVVSKAIVAEAVRIGAKQIVLEDLTNIRLRIKGNIGLNVLAVEAISTAIAMQRSIF
jgi:putative transposase